MAKGLFPVINFEELPETNEVRYTFDTGPYIRQMAEQVSAAVESYAEAEVVKILRDKGYYILDQRGREGVPSLHICSKCGRRHHTDPAAPENGEKR